MKKSLWFSLTCAVLAALPVFGVCPSADLTGDCFVDLEDLALLSTRWMTQDPVQEAQDFSLFVDQWLTGDQLHSGMVWIYINDPNISGHEGFTGYMSQYETTNEEYCHFLNSALASGDILVNGNMVYGATGSNPGNDFDGEIYYQLDGTGITWNGATQGGATRITYENGSFTVIPGFEKHPVTYVSWYGATAFCSYFGWRLPSEWEWQAVADYDGSYLYGCGPINNSRANYEKSIHPSGTTPVGAFGMYGYGMADMAGNVFEWTSSSFNIDYCVFRGGSWDNSDYFCKVSYWGSGGPHFRSCNLGFRVCR